MHPPATLFSTSPRAHRRSASASTPTSTKARLRALFSTSNRKKQQEKNWRIAQHPSVSTPRYILAVLSHGGKKDGRAKAPKKSAAGRSPCVRACAISYMHWVGPRGPTPPAGSYPLGDCTAILRKRGPEGTLPA